MRTGTGGDQRFHAEALGHLRHSPADVAVADDAQFLAGKFQGWIIEHGVHRAFFPRTRAHQLAISARTCRQLQNKRHGKLGDGLSGVSGNIAYLNSACPGSFQIDVVGAGCGDGDQLETFGCR